MFPYIVRSIRYILPLVVLLLIATYLVLSPALFTHAAAPATHHVAAPHVKGSTEDTPDMLWGGN